MPLARVHRLFAALALFTWSGCAAAPPAEPVPDPARLVLVATWRSGAKGGTEILAVQPRSGRVAVTRAEEHAVTVLDLSDPTRPRHVADHPLPAGGGELTAVGFHPRLDIVLAVVCSARAGERGRVHALDATSGALLASAETGVDPDSIAIDAVGRVAAVCDEAEDFLYDPATRSLRSGPGSVTFLDLAGLPDALAARTVELPDLAAFGVAAPVGRWLERPVDLDGDGVIGAQVDLDGDGAFDGELEIVSCDGAPLVVLEARGERALRVPLSSAAPALLEPEYAAFSPDGRWLYVTLQENDALAVFDVAERRLAGVWDLGVTRHLADRTEDGAVRFDEELVARREPDGVACTPDGRYVVTADEGDSDPPAAGTPAGQATGGGRTLSVFDAATGALVGDTGGQIDAAADAVGAYPDGRSDSKGTEPENLVVFAAGGTVWAAVGLERANAVALVSLADPRAPRVVGVTRLADDSVAPEGVALLVRDGRTFVLTANEVSGDVSVLELVRR